MAFLPVAPASPQPVCRLLAQSFSTFAHMAVAGQMLMAFDIDGTLVTEPSPDDSPSQRTIDAINAAGEQRAIITLATGRAADDALAFARRHFPTRCKYVISGNGRNIVLASTGESILSTPNNESLAIDPLALAVVSEGLRNVDASVSTTVGIKTLHEKTVYFRDQPNPRWVCERWPEVPSVRDVVVVNALRPILEAVAAGTATEYLAVESALIFRGDDDPEGMGFRTAWRAFLSAGATNRNAAAQLNVIGATTDAESDSVDHHIKSGTGFGRDFLMVEASGVDKASALMKLAQQVGIPKERVVAFGNDYNDIGMLKVAGLGVRCPALLLWPYFPVTHQRCACPPPRTGRHEGLTTERGRHRRRDYNTHCRGGWCRATA